MLRTLSPVDGRVYGRKRRDPIERQQLVRRNEQLGLDDDILQAARRERREPRFESA